MVINIFNLEEIVFILCENLHMGEEYTGRYHYRDESNNQDCIIVEKDNLWIWVNYCGWICLTTGEYLFIDDE